MTAPGTATRAGGIDGESRRARKPPAGAVLRHRGGAAGRVRALDGGRRRQGARAGRAYRRRARRSRHRRGQLDPALRGPSRADRDPAQGHGDEGAAAHGRERAAADRAQGERPQRARRHRQVQGGAGRGTTRSVGHAGRNAGAGGRPVRARPHPPAIRAGRGERPGRNAGRRGSSRASRSTALHPRRPGRPGSSATSPARWMRSRCRCGCRRAAMPRR